MSVPLSLSILCLLPLITCGDGQRNIAFVHVFTRPLRYTVKDGGGIPVYNAVVKNLQETRCEKFANRELNQEVIPDLNLKALSDEGVMDIAWGIRQDKEARKQTFLLSLKLKFAADGFMVSYHNRRCLLISIKPLPLVKNHGPVTFHFREVSIYNVSNAVLDVELRTGQPNCKVQSTGPSRQCFPVMSVSRHTDVNIITPITEPSAPSIFDRPPAPTPPTPHPPQPPPLPPTPCKSDCLLFIMSCVVFVILLTLTVFCFKRTQACRRSSGSRINSSPSNNSTTSSCLQYTPVSTQEQRQMSGNCGYYKD